MKGKNNPPQTAHNIVEKMSRREGSAMELQAQLAVLLASVEQLREEQKLLDEMTPTKRREALDLDYIEQTIKEFEQQMNRNYSEMEYSDRIDREFLDKMEENVELSRQIQSLKERFKGHIPLINELENKIRGLKSILAQWRRSERKQNTSNLN